MLSEVSAKGANFATPAFTNKTSILPSFCETSAYSLSMSASLATSPCTATTPFPIVFTPSSRVFLLRPRMATFAPSSCNRFAVASPIPLLPPVTTATFPSSLFMVISLYPCALLNSPLRKLGRCPFCALPALRHLDDYRSNRLHLSWRYFPGGRPLWREGPQVRYTSCRPM